MLERLFSEYDASLLTLLRKLIKEIGIGTDGKQDEGFDSYRTALDLVGLKSLSEETAGILRYYLGSAISLNSLKTISDEAVAALAKYRGHIDLEGIRSLSEKALHAFTNHQDRFSYNGLSLGISQLEDSTADILANFKSHKIFLPKLKRISASAAINLSKYKGEIYLTGLKQLSLTAARCLASHHGTLTLGRACDLSDEAAVAIRYHPHLQWR